MEAKYTLAALLENKPFGFKTELAKKIGVTTSTLRRWTKIPQDSKDGIAFANLEKLATFFEVTVEQLLTPPSPKN